MQRRAPARALGLTEEAHTGLGRRAIAFASVARDAGADDIFPAHLATAVTGHHMIEVQHLSGEDLAAILTSVLVAVENIIPSKFDLFFRKTIIEEKHDHTRHPHFESHGAHHISAAIVLGDIMPLFEIERLVAIALFMDNMSVSGVEESEGPPNRADMDCLPQSVQH